jgi:hypothetical protein
MICEGLNGNSSSGSVGVGEPLVVFLREDENFAFHSGTPHNAVDGW